MLCSAQATARVSADAHRARVPYYRQAGGAATRLIMSSLAGPGGLSEQEAAAVRYPHPCPRPRPCLHPPCACGAQARKVVSQKTSQLREAKQDAQRDRREKERTAEERRQELEAVWNAQD